MWEIYYTKQAKKDAKKLASANLKDKAKELLDIIKENPYASKEWSGTHTELEKKRKKIDRAVRRMLVKHREEDATNQVNDHSRRAAEKKQIKTLRQASRKLKKHLATTPERRGTRNKPIKSNITDPDSAKMKTSRGTIQGYNGKDCRVCPLQQQCMRKPVNQVGRQVYFRMGASSKPDVLEQMRVRIDSARKAGIYTASAWVR